MLANLRQFQTLALICKRAQVTLDGIVVTLSMYFCKLAQVPSEGIVAPSEGIVVTPSMYFCKLAQVALEGIVSPSMYFVNWRKYRVRGLLLHHTLRICKRVQEPSGALIVSYALAH